MIKGKIKLASKGKAGLQNGAFRNAAAGLYRNGTFLLTAVLLGAFLLLPVYAEDQPSDAEGESESSILPIAEGDLIRIEMKEHDQLFFEDRVSDSGTVRIPFYGEFRISGMLPELAVQRLEKELEKELYYQATVSVTVIERSPGNIFVYGAVKNPGMVSLPHFNRVTRLQVLSSVGGFNRWAVPENAYVIRVDTDGTSERRIPLDLTQRVSIGKEESAIAFKPGDILIVPGVGGDIHALSSEGVEVIVVGQVNQPGIVHFAPGERNTVMRAIFKAGGLSEFARAREVQLIHYTSDGERQVEVVDMDAVLNRGELTKDVNVTTGDMVSVPARIFNF